MGDSAYLLKPWLLQVPTERQNKIPWLFPDMNFNFPDDIGAKYFINCARKVHQDQTSKLLHDWNVKFPDILTKFHFSLTDHKIPWQFPDLEKIQISLMRMNPVILHLF